MELELKELIQTNYNHLIGLYERINSHELLYRIVLDNDVNNPKTQFITNKLYENNNLFWEHK
jgi:hypothetical protein